MEAAGIPGEMNVADTRINVGDQEKSLTKDLNENVMKWFRRRNGDTLKGALAFVPWVLQQSYFDGALDEDKVVVHHGLGAVLRSGTIGFAALTETLSGVQNGAEVLSECLHQFFTPLVELLNDYRGDVIKFTGQSLTVYFPEVDDTKSPKYNGIVPPHGTYGLPDLGRMATAVLRASACCIEIHKRLNNFDTGEAGVALSLHIGIGCGPVSILQVGGIAPPDTPVKRYEYVIAGPPLEQVSIAEPLAKQGETCLSPQAWEHVKDGVIEGAPLEDRPDFHLLLRMDESKYTFPTVKHAAKENDSRSDKQFSGSDLNIIRRYVPSSVFKQIECGTLNYVNEMRRTSIVFISGSGLDVLENPDRGNELMRAVQQACYDHEGTLNKIWLKGKDHLLFLLVFGLPPLVHVDDPTRAVLACFDLVRVFKSMGLIGRFGVTTSSSYCGVVGSDMRMEYTVLGDHVDLAAKLKEEAPANGIMTDEDTKDLVLPEIVMNALASVRVKGKSVSVPTFQPMLKEHPAQIGLTPAGKIRFPWYETPIGGGSNSQLLNVQQLCSVKGWEGIIKAQEMLGGPFNPEIYEADTVITRGEPPSAPPVGSPLSVGGVVVLMGATGGGKVELAEHIVMHSSMKFHMMPVFGTMGPRPGGAVGFASELLRSTLSIYRFYNASLPKDDVQALTTLLDDKPERQTHMPALKIALQDQTAKENADQILKKGLDVVISLLKDLVKKSKINIVMQFENGSNLFDKTLQKDQAVFWDAVTRLMELVEGHQRIAMLVVTQAPDEKVNGAHYRWVMQNAAIKCAQQANTLLTLDGLTEETIVEYMSSYLDVPEQIVPKAMRQFVAKVTLGNPLYIRETVDQLQEDQHVFINRSASGVAKGLECKDIDKCDIAKWTHTNMVGRTICTLQSLEPLEATVLKMSTCFSGPFALPDLAASLASKWADTTFFDFLRLYQSLVKLVNQNCIDKVEAPQEAGPQTHGDFGKTQYFQTNNLLIRAIATSMVLEQQRKSVKRQALVDRALSRELPGKMEIIQKKKKAQHIPWYYEQAFRRMS
jgi:class 3 adenylate cyclase